VNEPTPITRTSEQEREAKLAAAKLAQQQREQGLKGQAKREGREEREREILQQVGAQTIEEIGMIGAVQAQFQAAIDRMAHEHKNEVKRSERTGFARGAAFFGLPFAAAIAVLMMAVAFFFQQSAFNQSLEQGVWSTAVDRVTNQP
jgi:hypothetical protein